MLRNRLHNRNGAGAAFTVIELMLAVAIMGVIIYALYNIFNQTQKALRSSEAQSGISEKARAIMDMLVREIEQTQPTLLSYSTNAGVTNFYVQLDFFPRVQMDDRENSTVRRRTNVLDSFFFTVEETNFWNVVGYKINHSQNVVGELKRFSATNHFRHDPLRFMEAGSNFVKGVPITNETYFHHIADGVIHLRLTPYDINGRLLAYNTTNKVPENYRIYRSRAGGAPMSPPNQYSDVPNRFSGNVFLEQSVINSTNETTAAFVSNAVPAYVELELGMLEPDTLRQYYRMLEDANPNANAFLGDKITKVHLFRQRIPIRTAEQ